MFTPGGASPAPTKREAKVDAWASWGAAVLRPYTKSSRRGEGGLLRSGGEGFGGVAFDADGVPDLGDFAVYVD